MGYKGGAALGELPAVARGHVSKHVLRVEIEPRPEDPALDPALKVDSPRRMTTTLDGEVTELFKRLRDSVYRYLVVVLQDPSVAEEITQEAFLELYCCLRDRKAIKNVRAWVFRVARNLALNEKKRRRFVTGEGSTTGGGLHLQPGSGPLDPERVTLEQERMDLAMQQLSQQQHECLVLRLEGFRYREIAEILGLSVPNVAQSLRRAIKKLMKELA
jgi:RNA polymerase sigma-70 factor (ECF subfamily)